MDNRARRLVNSALETRVPPFAKTNASEAVKRLRNVIDEDDTLMPKTRACCRENETSSNELLDPDSQVQITPTICDAINSGNTASESLLETHHEESAIDDGDFSPDDSEDEYRPHKTKPTSFLIGSRRISTSSSNSSSSSSSESSSTSSSYTSIQSASILTQNHTMVSSLVNQDNIDYDAPLANNCPPDENITEAPPNNLTNNNEPNMISQTAESPKKNKKIRSRNPNAWKKNKRSMLKNSGLEYTSRTGKPVGAKVMRPPCSDKCKLKCSEHFSQDQRTDIFNMYWKLASLQRQRDFLNATISVLQSAQRRLKTGAVKNRKPNTFYSLTLNSKSIRVCKTFLLNTLGISERTFRTVIEAKSNDKSMGVAPVDNRGRHKNHTKINPEVQESVRIHINSIHRIESHYLRANTTREFIDGGLTIADLHRDYKKMRLSENKEAATYDSYFRIFNTEFNISFFVPKKDQCDICEQYKNAVEEEKEKLETNYSEHCRQKVLSRIEKKTDIEMCKVPESNEIVAVYDLQAVMPVPIGESSSFYYKSKLNCLNFTVLDIQENITYCYFWHEAMGGRGAVEIGSCILKYLQQVSIKKPSCNITFYSDNCGGQQKNRFIFSMYLYAVKTLPINKITHKFLIRGHTQNDGDVTHSLIEKSIKRARRSGAIYVPDQYVQIIRTAKKNGNPFNVKELNFDEFYDLKQLTDEIGLNTAKNVEGSTIKVSDIKVIEFSKSDDTLYRYKYSFDGDWSEAEIKRTLQRSSSQRVNKPVADINLVQAYTAKRELPANKKADLRELLNKNIIPRYYLPYYDSIL